MSGIYAKAMFRRSYKRDGRTGWGWSVYIVDPLRTVGHVDTEAEADALIAALDAGDVEDTDRDGMRRIVGQVSRSPLRSYSERTGRTA